MTSLPLFSSSRALTVAACFSALLLPGLHAQNIVDNFDTFPSSAGNGWSGAWGTNTGTNGGTNGTATISASSVSTTPVNASGNYLSFTGGTSETGDRTQYNSAVNRRYADFGDVDVTQTHVINFDFRIDSLTGFDSGSDFVGAFGQTNQFSNNYNATGSWLVRAFAGTQAGSPAYTWVAFNGDQAGGAYSGSNLVALKDGSNNGLIAQVGTVYNITVVNYTQTGTYDVHVTDGVTTVSATALGYRTANWGNDTPSSLIIAFQSQVNALGDSATFSVDNLVISNIPEPGSLGFLAGSAALLFAWTQSRGPRH